MIRQIKRRSINESEMIASVIDVASHFYKIDVSDFAGAFMLVSRNAAHWENDIDGPKDLSAFRERFLEEQ